MMSGASQAAALAIYFLLAVTFGPQPAFAASQLPEGFVRLSEIAPEIRQDIRYASAHNFTGHIVPGYNGPVCILARPVALALKSVQTVLMSQGLTLIVLDCYRPRQAVGAFLNWAKNPEVSEETKRYFPRISKRDIVRLGYVAGHSSHSRGVAVDLTIGRLNPETLPPTDGVSINRSPCNAPGADLNPPSALEMGTSFDCFDVASHTQHPNLSPVARNNRALLVRAMRAEGFENYPREWWHFTLPIAGYDKAMDFPVD